MFTGIVEEIGTVEAVTPIEGSREIVIRAPALDDLVPGQSVSVDGACQTVVRLIEGGFTVEAIGTTLSRTILGRYEAGTHVNLERAMQMGGRLDGHLVQGHVDGTGELLEVRQEGIYHLMDFRIPEEIARQTILHGSIALNGVSLTVNALEGADRCQVGIISYTWGHTNLGLLQPGDPVNVEGDLIGKYVGKLVLSGMLDSLPIRGEGNSN